MSFLTLARGDPDALDLLKRAVAARYGLRPVVVESVRLSMSGRAKGPLGLPAQAFTTASYVNTSHWRWDQTRKIFSLTLGSTIASFDGGAYYERSGKVTGRYSEPEAMQGARSRLWAELALFLSPLTLPGVMVTAVGGKTFKASPEGYQSVVATLSLNDDYTIKQIETSGYRAAQKRPVLLKIMPEDGMQTFEGFIFPRQIRYEWGDGVTATYTVTRIETNPKLPLTDFTMS